MKTYSISEAASVLGVDRTTLRRWVRQKRVPAPTPGIVDGVLSKLWTENDMMQVRKYKVTSYWGKGLDRRTGKKAKSK
jgi:predicted site-specific integrase-resolvase